MRAAIHALLLLSSCAALAQAAPFGAVRRGVAAEVDVNVQDEELSVVVEKLARATGKTVLFDDTLRGRISISVGHKVAGGEALAILDAALLMKGFAVLRAGGAIYKILPIGEAGAGAPFEDRDGERSSEAGTSFITTLVRLQVADAEQIAAKLQHLVAHERSVLAYPPTNSLVLVGTEAEIQRLIGLVQVLDAGTPEELLVRTLRHRAAETVAAFLGEILAPAAGQDPLEVWSDARTNTILARGAPEQLEGARSLIRELDVPLATAGPIHVIRILHRDVEELEQLLRGLGSGPARRPGAAPGGPEAGEVLSGRAFNVVAEPATNSLLIDADPDTLALLGEVIEELDQEQPQVLVEITAFEISNPTTLALGFDWFIPAVNSDSASKIASFTSNPSGGGLRAEAGPDTSFFGRVSRDPIIVPFVDDSGFPINVVLPRETAVITADSREIETQVLMNPKLLMAPGDEHELFAGSNVPVPVAAAGAAEAAQLSGTQTRLDIQRQDVGVIVRVTPNLGRAGKVSLKLDLEISRLGESVAGPVEQVGPTIEKREVTTDVSLSDGEVAIIGTSQQRSVQTAERSTPFVRAIPLLGYLFRSGRTDVEDVHIVFAVQARILRTSTEVLADSIRERLAFRRGRARIEGLERTAGAPYAVLLDTFETDHAAEALATRMRARGAHAQVGHFQDEFGQLHDLYLTGYETLAEAAAASTALHEEGFDPRLAILPTPQSLAHTKRSTPLTTNYPLLP